MKDLETEVSRSIISMLLKEPFFAHLLSGIVRRSSKNIDTAAVYAIGARVELRINPDFFLETITDPLERIGIIKHETLHLLFKHLFRFNRSKHHPLIFNLAADLVVNQYVEPAWKLPKDSIFLHTFSDLELEKEKDIEYYYQKLYDLYQEMCEKIPGYSPFALDKKFTFKGLSAPKSAKVLHDLMVHGWCCDHLFDQIDPNDCTLSESELDRIIAQTKDRCGAKAWGTLPGIIQQCIAKIIESRLPQVDWRRVIKIFSASSRRTQIKHTIKKQSKRYGTRPGIRIKRFQNLAVIIDTSGSISTHDFQLFFGEIHGLWREGADITVIECDAEVQRTYPYKGKIPETVFGRGGTSFDPPFEWMRKQKMIHFDGCIYLTDACGPAPTLKPPCKLLWVITPEGASGQDLLCGKTIKMK